MAEASTETVDTSAVTLMEQEVNDVALMETSCLATGCEYLNKLISLHCKNRLTYWYKVSGLQILSNPNLMPMTSDFILK